jgi:Ca2+-binding RTX toxin-like protein
MSGGNGDDTMLGYDGNDDMWGDNGDDDMFGENGDDDMWGGNGEDYMSGGDGDDEMSGGNQNDVMNGDDGDDVVSGDNGDDDVNGGDGDNVLYGGNGDDFLSGDDGCDTMTGGDGKDVFEVHLTWDGQSFSSTDQSDGECCDTVTDFDMLDDNDVLTFVIDDQSGAADDTALFAALDSVTTVTQGAGGTTIEVAGSCTDLLGVGANHPFEFTSLGDINNFSDGNYQYEAVDIVIV